MNTIPFEDALATPLSNGVSYPARLRGTGIPMVNMGEAFSYDVIKNQRCELVPLTDREMDRFLLEEGDLLFVRQSLKYEGAGRCVYVDRGDGPRTWEGHLIRARLNRNIADPRYYYHYFRSPPGRRNMESIVEQVAAAGIRGSDLRRLKVPSPPLKYQQSVAEVLGALDDKIAVNKQIAETALDLAEALYAHKSSYSEGWHSLPLGKTARWLSGGTPKTSEPSYWDGDIPWISASSLKSPWIDDSERKVTQLGAENGTRIAPEKSIIFVVRGMSLTSEFRVGLTQREVAFGQDCKALIPHAGIDAATLFLAIKTSTREILEFVDLAGHGTGRLATDRIADLSVRLPERGDSADEFRGSVVPLVERASATKRETRALTSLRDTLLPQLVTGKLRIKDAEHVVEDAI